MHDWINLRSLTVGAMKIPAFSMLTVLKRIKIRPGMTTSSFIMASGENIINFSNLSKGKPICQTLELFEYMRHTTWFNNEIFCDDSLHSLLDTFSKLSAIDLTYTGITLTRTGIVQKLGTLTRLKS
jgi:hypothetical protein